MFTFVCKSLISVICYNIYTIAGELDGVGML